MANPTDVAEFEFSKENILPIQQGRKANVLKSALSVQPEDKLLQQRRSYEQQLRSYSGDDPLSIWSSYIKWVEQNYPKGGREGNICKLIQQCLLNLKDEVKYHNDDRFIDIWIKFANLSNRPNEVYTNMFSRGIGCFSARFYIAWAWEVEQSGDIKRAEEILSEGLRKNAQPLDNLKSTHAEVQMRLTKSFVLDNEKVTFENDHRSAFTMLKTQGKNKAPISRVGDSTIPTNNQQMKLSQQKAHSKNTHGKIPFKIYSAENEMSSLPSQNKDSNFIIHSDGKKENQKKPSKWTKVKVQQTFSDAPKAPEFIVHHDNAPQPESAKKLPQSTKVLTTRSEPWVPAVALFEPPNPKMRPMYDKAKVYGGGEEFSFEEIYAIKWLEKQKRLEKERKRLQEEQEKDDLKKQLKQLQEKMQYLETLAAPVFQQSKQVDVISKNSSTDSQVQQQPSLIKDKPKDTENTSSQSLLISAHRGTPTATAVAMSGSNITTNCLHSNKQPDKLQQKTNTKNESEVENNKKHGIFEDINVISEELHIPVRETSNRKPKKVLEILPNSLPLVNTYISDLNPINNKKKEDPTSLEPSSDFLKSPDQSKYVTKRQNYGNTYMANEVDCMMQELYNGTIGHNAELDDLSFNVNLEKNNYDFDLDELDKNGALLTCNDGQKANLDFDTPELLPGDSQKKSDKEETLEAFAIYHDPTEVLPLKSAVPSFPIFHDDNHIKVNDENTPPQHMQFDIHSSDTFKNDNLENDPKSLDADKNSKPLSPVKDKDFEDFENIPPADYIQNTDKRELSGILQPSKNIHYVPLEKQMEEDLHEEINEEYLTDVRPLDANLTLLTAEQFDAAACFMSTPCVKPQPTGIRDTIKEMGTNIPKVLSAQSEHNFENASLIQILNDAIILADSDKINELLRQILFDVTKRKNPAIFKEVCYNVMDRLRLCCGYTRNEKLKLTLQHCITLIETNVEKNKDFSQTNLISNCHTLQLSTIMETSRESKSSSSNSCMVSMKQRSMQNSTQLNSISTLAKVSIAEIHEKSKLVELSEIISEEKTKPEATLCMKNDASVIDEDNLDPFDPKITDKLLTLIDVPLSQRENFYDYKNLPFHIKIGSGVKLGNIECLVDNLYAEGAYAKVYSAQCVGNSFVNFDQTLFIPTSKLAIKVCKDANEWEFYICSELTKRLAEKNLSPDISESVMDVKSAVAFENCLVLVSDLLEHGTLLDIVNFFKKQQTRTPEYLVMFFALEMLHIVSGLHKCGIVHGDIKPDNFVLNEIPNPNEVESMLGEPRCLRLIDFGRAIDLKSFKEGITFSVIVKTDGFQCIPMREGRPWVFESDWYGVLSCIHVLLFSEYMDVRKNADNQWEPVQKFKRYFQTDIWQPLFQTLLNIPSCYDVPDLTPFITMLTEKLQKQSKAFKMQLLQMKLAFGKKSST